MQEVPPATPFDDGAEAVLRQIAKDFEADEKLQQLLKRLGLQGKVPSPLATSAPGTASGPVAAAIARCAHPRCAHPRPRTCAEGRVGTGAPEGDPQGAASDHLVELAPRLREDGGR